MTLLVTATSRLDITTRTTVGLSLDLQILDRSGAVYDDFTGGAFTFKMDNAAATSLTLGNGIVSDDYEAALMTINLPSGLVAGTYNYECRYTRSGAATPALLFYGTVTVEAGIA